MSGAKHPPLEPPEPAGPAEAEGRARRADPAAVASPSRTLVRCLASLAVMAPWPLLFILLMRAQFESPSDAGFFFGGITLFPLLVLALFGSISEEATIAILVVVWFAAALLPSPLFRKRLRSKRSVGVMLGVQSLF